MMALSFVISVRKNCDGNRSLQKPMIMSFFVSLTDIKNSLPLFASYSITSVFNESLSISRPIGSLQRMHSHFGLYLSWMYCRKFVNSTPLAHIFVGTSRKIRCTRQYLGTVFFIRTRRSDASSAVTGVNFPCFHWTYNVVRGATMQGYIFNMSGR